MFKIAAFLSPLNRNIEKRNYFFLLPTFPPQPTAKRMFFPGFQKKEHLHPHFQAISQLSQRRKPAGANAKGWSLIHIGPLLHGCLTCYQHSHLRCVPLHGGSHTLDTAVPIGGRPSNTCAFCPGFWSAMWGWGSQPFSPAQQVRWVN